MTLILLLVFSLLVWTVQLKKPPTVRQRLTATLACLVTDGTSINSESCACGTSVCTSSNGLFCLASLSTCNSKIMCSVADGSSVNSGNCACGTSDCAQSSGLFCSALNNTCGEVATSNKFVVTVLQNSNRPPKFITFLKNILLQNKLDVKELNGKLKVSQTSTTKTFKCTIDVEKIKVEQTKKWSHIFETNPNSLVGSTPFTMDEIKEIQKRSLLPKDDVPIYIIARDNKNVDTDGATIIRFNSHDNEKRNIDFKTFCL